MSDSKDQREEMVRTQVARRGIEDIRVLNAMRRVPRELFMLAAHRDRAYRDGAQSIGCGQTISQPYIVGLMTESLRMGKDAKVLEIGTGSGYQTAVLAEIAAAVYTVERIAKLARDARRRLASMGYDNIRFRLGDGNEGWPEEAPFDAIIVTAAAPGVPEALLAQLGDDGVAVIPVGMGQQDLLRFTRDAEGSWCGEHLCWCMFVPLVPGTS